MRYSQMVGTARDFAVTIFVPLHRNCDVRLDACGQSEVGVSNRNAAEELIKHVGERTVAYGKVIRGDDMTDSEYLAVAFGSHDEYLAALPLLNFKYDHGFGGQNLFGWVVFDDGTWLERGEYDGSEWWEYKQCPTREWVAAYTRSW